MYLAAGHINGLGFLFCDITLRSRERKMLQGKLFCFIKKKNEIVAHNNSYKSETKVLAEHLELPDHNTFVLALFLSSFYPSSIDNAFVSMVTSVYLFHFCIAC